MRPRSRRLYRSFRVASSAINCLRSTRNPTHSPSSPSLSVRRCLSPHKRPKGVRYWPTVQRSEIVGFINAAPLSIPYNPNPLRDPEALIHSRRVNLYSAKVQPPGISGGWSRSPDPLSDRCSIRPALCRQSIAPPQQPHQRLRTIFSVFFLRLIEQPRRQLGALQLFAQIADGLAGNAKVLRLQLNHEAG